MTRPVQYFSDDYLTRCAAMTPTQRAQFLDDFRRLGTANAGRRKLISLRVPECTLAAFKAKAKVNGISYQRKIQELMAEWVVGNH